MEKKKKFVWIISDIHGCYDEFIRLLNYSEKYDTEKYIFLGDYVDRGEESRKVINSIIEIKKEKILLMGNHEKMMYDFLTKLNKQNYKIYYELWFMNGGEKTLLSYFENKEILREILQNDPMMMLKKIFQTIENDGHLDFLNSLKFSYQEKFRINKKNKNFIFVHAGLNPFINIEEQLAINRIEDYEEFILKHQISPAETIIWIREKFLKTDFEFLNGNILVHGHTPVHNVLAKDTDDKYKILNSEIIMPIINYDKEGKITTINIDTGCVYGGFLTFLGLNENYLSDGKILILQATKRNRKIYEYLIEFDSSLYK